MSHNKFYKVSVFVTVLFLAIVASYIFIQKTNVHAAGPASAWFGVASSADGTKLVAVTWCGPIFTSTDSGATWVNQSDAGNHCWKNVTSSADGTKLAAINSNDGHIYTSVDSGVTWIKQLGSGPEKSWFGIASDSTGEKLVATEDGGGIYTSSDGGVTWIDRYTSGNLLWRNVASSADGTKLVAATNDGYVYTSTDSGVTWSTNGNSSGSHSWYAVASSADGTKLVATDYNGYIYTSTDSGATWSTNGDSSGTHAWYGASSSADGTKLAAIDAGNGYIYTSTDSGATWTTHSNSSGNDYWYSIASDSTGTKLVAGSNSKLSLSNDGGVTWNDNVGTFGNITLTIKDPDGGAVPGVLVEAVCSDDWTEFGTTDSNGMITGLPPGGAGCGEADTILFRLSKSGYLTAISSSRQGYSRSYYTSTDNNYSMMITPLFDGDVSTSYTAQFWNAGDKGSSGPEFPYGAPVVATTTATIDADWGNASARTRAQC